MAAPLTTRQREILRLAAEGLGNREIAARLECAPSTVANHLRLAFARLGVSNRVDAWRALGWLEPPAVAADRLFDLPTPT